MSAIPLTPTAPRCRRRPRPALLVYAGLWLFTALAAGAALAWPALGPGTAPHPALKPTLATSASILEDNTRVLAPAILLAPLGFTANRATRTFGNLLVALPLAASAIDVGLALGRWGGRLLPYIPQLPVEWLAAALAGAAWLDARRHGRDPRRLALHAAATLALLALAAAIETFATPHVR